ncbi:hypothetical protein Q1695_000046 [Nippostrongylus brasiliensis]|nr:hypothetical protein Q1695_000046 [Nippostrongylus brasiliensis]
MWTQFSAGTKKGTDYHLLRPRGTFGQGIVSPCYPVNLLSNYIHRMNGIIQRTTHWMSTRKSSGMKIRNFSLKTLHYVVYIV